MTPQAQDPESSAATHSTAGRAAHGEPARTRRGAWLAVAAAVALCAARLVHLGADLPSWVSPLNAGEYVDEGYKTLSPRNLVLFGSERWHPGDDYPGWMAFSPLTNWPYYWSFRALGARVESARLVTLVYFALFLALYTWAMLGRYPPGLVLAGLALLGLDSALFFFSRIALLEVPLIAFVYGLLFVLARRGDTAVWWPLAACAALCALVSATIKLSAFVYLAPIAAGLLVRAVWLAESATARRLLVGALAASALGAGAFLWLLRDAWLLRLDLHPWSWVDSLLASPLAWFAPFLFLSGWLCAVHLAVCDPARALASTYRTAILSLALLGPLLLALFPNDPPRYYAPLLPAYALAIVEWLWLGGPRLEPVRARPVVAALAAAALAYAWFTATRVIDHALVQLAIPIGEEPGISSFSLRVLAVPPMLAIGGAVCATHGAILRGRLVAPVAFAALGLWALHSGAALAHWELHPSYQGSSARAAIARAVPPGATLIGDWAPFLALGTPLRALYMNGQFNVPARLTELRPDYFVYSDTPQCNQSLVELSALHGVRLLAPILASQYNGRAVVLFPIDYASAARSAPQASAGGPRRAGRADANAITPVTASPQTRRSPPRATGSA